MKNKNPKNFILSAVLLAAAILPAGARASSPDTLRLSTQGWYVGLEGGVPFGIATFSGFGHDKTRAGYDAGIYGGYRFSPVLSAELTAKWGATSLSARDCCAEGGYWLGSDGNRYRVPVAGMDGWSYSDIKSRVSLQQYGARLNVNLLGFFERTKSGRWTLDVSPALYAVGTKAAIKTIAGNETVLKDRTRWHLGYGGNVQAAYRLTDNISLGIYSGITALTGKQPDGIPEYRHTCNLLWESGVRVGWTFGGKRKAAKAARIEQAASVTTPATAVCPEATELPAVVTAQQKPVVIAETVTTDSVAGPTETTKEKPVKKGVAEQVKTAIVTFPTVNFAFNRYDIARSEQPKLQAILDLMKDNPGMKVSLTGRCDTRGSKAVNDRISLRRAEAVKAWLVSHGIDAERITTVGMGSDFEEPDAAKARRVVTMEQKTEE